MKALFTCVLVALCVSCMPVDEPIAPFDRGGVDEQRVHMGPKYGTVIYYDVAGRRVESQRPIDMWSLAINADNTDSLIYLNTGMMMSATKVGAVAWESVTTSAAATPQARRYDAPSGDPDSTAFGRWWNNDGSSKGDVYLVHLGFNDDGQDMGWRKVAPIRVDASGITMRVALLEGANDTVVTVPRNPGYHRVGLLCSQPVNIVQHEPLPDTYDLVFTRYTYFFYAPDFLAYSVTGVLLGPNVLASRVSGKAFGDVVASDTLAFPLTPKKDAIGYEWKSYDIAKGVYTTDTSSVFLVRDRKGFLNKLRFLDFYSETGSKGSPLFVLQRL